MSEKRVLRGLVVPKIEEVMGGWKIKHKKELQNSFSSVTTIRMITPRRMR
jgi:hypothetical protein